MNKAKKVRRSVKASTDFFALLFYKSKNQKNYRV